MIINHTYINTDQTTHTHPHAHCTHGTCGVLDCLLFCDQTRPNLRISLVGYHCAIEFPCGVLLFYCCKYPTTYGVRVHTVHMALVRYFIVFSFVTKPGQTLEFLLWGTIVPLNFLVGYHCSIVASTPQPTAYASTPVCKHRQTGSSHCFSFVYTLSQHLSYVLYTFDKRGPFSNWGPYCSFCYKSPV